MLQKQTSDCLNQVSDQTYDDAIMACLKAAEAETGRWRWSIEQLTEIVAALMLASTVERLKRREMIQIRATLTIAPGAELDIEILDDAAMEEIIKMRQGLNS